MTLKIDKAGRIVLPKPIRDRLGFYEGAHLELAEDAGGVTLRALQQQPTLIRKGAFWVHTGKVSQEFDIVNAIERNREERDYKNLGR